VKLSLRQARRLALAAQGLDNNWKLPRGPEGVAQAVQRLGYVQIDTIAVVQRAHHHTLWSRRGDYRPKMLHRLQAEDRRVFEYWTHAASYVPMRDYRFYLPRMRAEGRRHQQFLKDHAELVREVVGRIRTEGPLGSADFAAPPGRKRGPWWDWKPAKRVLEALFSNGELMVSERRNFQRRYDLTERVLPTGTDTTPPSAEEEGRFRVRGVLAGHGVSDLRAWWLRDRHRFGRAAEELVEAGEAVRVELEGADGEPHYALTELVDDLARRRRGRKQIHLLSPFDNLVIHRQRLRKLFGFECKLECYVPAAKRRYGYFCLPILWGDTFLGRLDPKADRKNRTLTLHSLALEPGVWSDAWLAPLAKKLRRFAAFNDCDEVLVEETRPRKLRLALRRAMKDG
jgi:uncharacterized protein